MYEISLVLLGFCFGLLVKLSVSDKVTRFPKRSNVKTSVLAPEVVAYPKTVTLPITREKINLDAFPKPSTYRRIK